MEDSLTKDITSNIECIKTRFHNTTDLMLREINLGLDHPLNIIYIDGITDLNLLNESVIIPITEGFNYKNIPVKKCLIKDITNKILTTPNIKTTTSFNEICEEIIQGKAIIIVDGYEEAIVADITQWTERAIEESLGERSSRGPALGFTEKTKTNISILRGIVKTENLCIEKNTFGSKSKTDVFVLYIVDIVDKGVLKEVQNRIKRIRVKYILEALVVQKTVEGKPQSLFPLTLSSERPDVVASALLEGRVVVMVDGRPQVIIAPSLFVDFLQAPDEYYSSYGRFSNRWIRLLSFLLTVFLPGIYIALEEYGKEHLTKKTYNLLISQNEILPTIWQIVLLNILLRIILDSSFRVPKNAVLLISILGSVLLGQTAVDAKLIHPVSLIVMGIAFISSFTMGNKGLASSLTIFSISFIIIAHFFSFIGIFVGITFLILYMTSLKSIGVPYLSPFLPLRPMELKDSLFRGDIKKLVNSEHSYPEDN